MTHPLTLSAEAAARAVAKLTRGSCPHQMGGVASWDCQACVASALLAYAQKAVDEERERCRLAARMTCARVVVAEFDIDGESTSNAAFDERWPKEIAERALAPQPKEGKVIPLSELPNVLDALRKTAEESAEFEREEAYKNAQAWREHKDTPLL